MATEERSPQSNAFQWARLFRQEAVEAQRYRLLGEPSVFNAVPSWAAVVPLLGVAVVAIFASKLQYATCYDVHDAAISADGTRALVELDRFALEDVRAGAALTVKLPNQQDAVPVNVTRSDAAICGPELSCVRVETQAAHGDFVPGARDWQGAVICSAPRRVF